MPDNWGKVNAKDILKEAICALDIRDKISNLAVKAGREMSESDFQTVERIAEQNKEFIRVLLEHEPGSVFESPRERFDRAMTKLNTLLTKEW